ncbi:MAG: zf-HC2 domain-containing protein [Acetobacteraceae bacterium]|nr:zf-HC2 domain-containing protein [Acetobacteraceae bacterium]
MKQRGSPHQGMTPGIWGPCRETAGRPGGARPRRCRWERLSSAYWDGELAVPARAAFEAHLQGCPRCRQALAAFAALDGALKQALPPAPAPQRVLEGLTRALESQAPPARPRPAMKAGRAPRPLARRLTPLWLPPHPFPRLALRAVVGHWALAALGALASSLALEAASLALQAGSVVEAGPGLAAAARAAVANLPPGRAAELLAQGFTGLGGWFLRLAGWTGAWGGGP